VRKNISAFLVCSLLFGLLFTGISSFNLASGAVSVNGIISSDTTWTKVDSPYNLVGNVLVDNGVTLTIEAGATVNLNDYHIIVNGTMQALGSSSELITFTGSGYIEFTQFSTDGILENTDCEGTVYAGCDAKISSCSMMDLYLTPGSPEITGNTISGDLQFSSLSIAPVVSYNTISGEVRIPYHAAYPSGTITLSHNTIGNGITTDYELGNIIISYNEISGGVTCRRDWPGQHDAHIEFLYNTMTGDINLSGETTFSSNTVTGQIIAIGSNNILANNIITAPSSAPADSHGIYFPDESIDTYVNQTIICNTISGFSFGICVGPATTTPSYSTHKPLDKMPIIQGNQITNCQYGIKSSFPTIIADNTITNNYYGILARSSTIERNLVTNNHFGVYYGTVVNQNTITQNTIGIYYVWNLHYNNIHSNTQYNLDMGSNATNPGATSGTSNVNATYNWWGTTDTSAIDASIYDYYDNFELPKVDYTPFLTATNTQAVPQAVTAPTSPPTATTSPTPTATPPASTSNPTATPTQPSGTDDNPGINWDAIALPLTVGVIVGVVLAIGIIFFVRGKASPKPF
jgi:parallel beta-helix repeat protein